MPGAGFAPRTRETDASGLRFSFGDTLLDFRAMPRPSTILGLTRELVRTRWARLGRGSKILLVAGLLVGSVATVSYARCAIGSACGYDAGARTSGCPYSER